MGYEKLQTLFLYDMDRQWKKSKEGTVVEAVFRDCGKEAPWWIVGAPDHRPVQRARKVYFLYDT